MWRSLPSFKARILHWLVDYMTRISLQFLQKLFGRRVELLALHMFFTSTGLTCKMWSYCHTWMRSLLYSHSWTRKPLLLLEDDFRSNESGHFWLTNSFTNWCELNHQSSMAAMKSHEVKMKVCHCSERTVGHKSEYHARSCIMRGDVIPQVRLADVPNILCRTQNCATQRAVLKCSCVQVVKHHLLHLTFNLPSVYYCWS